MATCGVNAALEEAQAGIDSLKEKLQGGLNSIGDVGSIADTIKKKLSEINPPKDNSVNLQAELAGLSSLSPEEYTKKVAQLKAQFGSTMSELDSVIEKLPKPEGYNSGTDSIFNKMEAAINKLQNKVQSVLQGVTMEDAIADICGKVPNLEAVVILDKNGNPMTDDNGNLITKAPEKKPASPVTPNANPVKESKPSDPPAKGFTFAFTKAKMTQATNAKAAEWYDAMNTVLPKYGITTPERVSVFLGQITAEAGANLNMLKESSKYKPASYFSICQKRLGLKSVDECSPYLASPETTFQGLYEANINGEFHYMGYSLHGKGQIRKGDGAKFCGRGLKQLTGRANYARASYEIYRDDRLIVDPEQVATSKEVALETACWFWKSRNLNGPADKFDVVTVTKLVNGGDLGLATRKSVAEKALSVFKS